MAEDNSGVRTAPSDGSFGILGGYAPGMSVLPGASYDPHPWMPGINDTMDPGTMGQAPGLPDFGSMDDSQLASYLGQSGSSGWQNILNGLSGLSGLGGSGGSGAKSPGGSSGQSGGALNWLESLLGIGGGNAAGGLSGLGPYAAVGAYGLSQAQKAQKDAQAKANELKGLGSPYLDASKSLLDQYKSGTLRPEQQRVVDFTSEEGQKLIDSGQGLSAIAQQAFLDYQNGKLPAADEQKLQADITRQKQELRQRLSSSGIQDSSILAGYDQQIDAQATQTRQDLLDKRFATGNQAYDEWLKSTTQGQQLKLQGQVFAQEAFQSMMNNALALGAEGMQPVMQSIALAIQSDQDLSQQVSDLIGNLASAWAYQQAGKSGAPGTQGGASGGSSGGQSTLQQIIGGIGSVAGLVGNIGKLFGWGSTNPSGAGGQAATGGLGQIGGALADAGSIYGGIQQGGVAGTAQAATGAIDLAGKTGAISDTANIGGVDLGSAAGIVNVGANLAEGNYGGAGFAAADMLMGGPYAAVGNLIAGSLNKAFLGDSSKTRNVAAYAQATGAKSVTLPMGHMGMNYMVMPKSDGSFMLVSAQDFNDLAGSWYGGTFAPDGNQTNWQQKYVDFSNNLKPATPPKGYTFDSSTGKIMYKGKVAGSYGEIGG